MCVCRVCVFVCVGLDGVGYPDIIRKYQGWFHQELRYLHDSVTHKRLLHYTKHTEKILHNDSPSH